MIDLPSGVAPGSFIAEVLQNAAAELARDPDTECHATCSRGWSERCARAKSVRCRCACGGRNHGNQSARRSQQNERMELTPNGKLYYELLEERQVPSMSDILRRDDRVIRFERAARENGGPLFQVNLNEQGRPVVLLDGVPLRRRYVMHSHDGFEFGYGGSGPADLALNILALVIPVKEATRDGLYHDFKFAFIEPARAGTELPLAVVRRWVADQYTKRQEVHA